MFLHLQPWITIENLRFFLLVALPLNFTLAVIGITAGFCGPLGHKATEWCRWRYLSHARTRSMEIWLNFVVPLIMAYCILESYNAGWYFIGMFFSFSLALRFLRSWLLKLFPERGYLHHPQGLIWKDGRLHLVE